MALPDSKKMALPDSKLDSDISIVIGIIIIIILIIIMLASIPMGIYNIIWLIMGKKPLLESISDSSIGLIFDYIIIGIMPLSVRAFYKMRGKH